MVVRGRGQGGHGHRGTANYPADQGLIVFPTAPCTVPSARPGSGCTEVVGGREQEQGRGEESGDDGRVTDPNFSIIPPSSTDSLSALNCLNCFLKSFKLPKG